MKDFSLNPLPPQEASPKVPAGGLLGVEGLQGWSESPAAAWWLISTESEGDSKGCCRRS